MEKEIKIFENEEFGSVRTLKEEAGRVVFWQRCSCCVGVQQYKGRHKAAL